MIACLVSSGVLMRYIYEVKRGQSQEWKHRWLLYMNMIQRRLRRGGLTSSCGFAHARNDHERYNM